MTERKKITDLAWKVWDKWGLKKKEWKKNRGRKPKLVGEKRAIKALDIIAKNKVMEEPGEREWYKTKWRVKGERY